MNTARDDRFWVQLQHEPIAVEAPVRFLQDAGAGGIDVFLGTTRQWTGETETLELAYEAYEPMALREMSRLLREAAARWPVRQACLIHRLGVVPAGEASVLIGVSTPHRAEAFEACRWLIDTLKQQVPIWKREHYRDGRTEWIQGSVPPSVP